MNDDTDLVLGGITGDTGDSRLKKKLGQTQEQGRLEQNQNRAKHTCDDTWMNLNLTDYLFICILFCVLLFDF